MRNDAAIGWSLAGAASACFRAGVAGGERRGAVPPRDPSAVKAGVFGALRAGGLASATERSIVYLAGARPAGAGYRWRRGAR